MRHKIIILTIVALLLVPNFCYAAPDNDTIEINIEEIQDLPEIVAESFIVIERTTGKILYSKNENTKMFPASTTKIMTALLALEYGDLNDIVTVGNEANLCHKDGSKACLDLNEEIRLEDLLYGLMLPSGNDAAYTLAVYVARKVNQDPQMDYNEAIKYFVDMMNKKAQEIGATNTSYMNPHGYHDDNHYTTANDLSLIAKYAMNHKMFCNITSTYAHDYEDWNEFDKENTDKKVIRYWRNSNRLINENDDNYYPFAVGVKTGYTSKAGHCLVSAAIKDDLELIGVILKSNKENQWNDSKKILEYGFDNFTNYQLISTGQKIANKSVNDCIDEDIGTLDIVAKEGLRSIIAKKDTDNIRFDVTWDENYMKDGKLTITAPITKGQSFGIISYYLDNELLGQTDIISSRNVAKKKSINDIVKIPEKEEGKKAVYLIIAGAAIIILILLLRIRARKRRRRIYYKRYR